MLYITGDRGRSKGTRVLTVPGMARLVRGMSHSTSGRADIQSRQLRSMSHSQVPDLRRLTRGRSELQSPAEPYRTEGPAFITRSALFLSSAWSPSVIVHQLDDGGRGGRWSSEFPWCWRTDETTTCHGRSGSVSMRIRLKKTKQLVFLLKRHPYLCYFLFTSHGFKLLYQRCCVVAVT